MENFSNLSQILSAPKSDQLSFLNHLLDFTFTQEEIPEVQESTYKKAILYITCWIIMPQTSLPLPTEFTSVFSLLSTDTTSLFPKFLQKFEESYENLSEIICNDTLLSLLLTIPSCNQQLLSFLRPEHCISPLMWLLTYSPQHQKLASEFLPQAISKKGGVKELLECFSRGDNTWKLKNLYIKILKTTPRVKKIEYVGRVVEQVVEIMSQYNCDKIVENAMEEVSNFFLQKFPGTVLPYVKSVEERLNGSQIVKFFRVFVQYLPPNEVILFGISDLFQFFVEMWMFVSGTVLQVKNELLTIFVQFFVFWEQAGLNFTAFLMTGLKSYEFSQTNNEILFKKVSPEPFSSFSDVFSLFPCLSEVSGSSTIFPKIFSALLQDFNKSKNPNLMCCLSFLLESIEPIFLVNMPKNIEALLASCIFADSEELTAISLQILFYTPDENLSKDFLLKITPKVLEAKKSENFELAELGKKIDEKISKVLGSDQFSKKIERKVSHGWVKDLESSEAYLNAIGLHKLTLSLDEDLEIPWDKLREMLEKEDFVFGEALKCYVKALGFHTEFSLDTLFQSFWSSVDGIKKRILEILFFWSKTGANTLKFSSKLLEFTNHVILQEKNEEVVDGAIIVTGQLVRRLKNAFFPYLPQSMHNALSTLKLANSRLTIKSTLPKHLSSTLILLKKLLKHCSHSHKHLPEISSLLQLFTDLYPDTLPSLSIIVKNLQIQLDELKLNSLE